MMCFQTYHVLVLRVCMFDYNYVFLEYLLTALRLDVWFCMHILLQAEKSLFLYCIWNNRHVRVARAYLLVYTNLLVIRLDNLVGHPTKTASICMWLRLMTAAWYINLIGQTGSFTSMLRRWIKSLFICSTNTSKLLLIVALIVPSIILAISNLGG